MVLGQQSTKKRRNGSSNKDR